MPSLRPRKPARAAAGELTITVDWFGEKHEITFSKHARVAPLPWVGIPVLDGEAYLWRPPPANPQPQPAELVPGVPSEMIDSILHELELNGPRWIALLPPAGLRADGDTPQEALDALAKELARLAPGGDA
jgi:hypothetical protein